MESTFNRVTITTVAGVAAVAGCADGSTHSRSRSRVSTPCARIVSGMQRAEEVAPFVAWHDPQRRHER